MEKYLIVRHSKIGAIYIKSDGIGNRIYLGYSEKDAIKLFRRDFNVERKHFTIIYV